MSRHSIFLTVLIVFFGLTAFWGYWTSQPVAAVPNRVIFSAATQGAVAFEHKRHIEQHAQKCQSCHHDYSAAIPETHGITACASCHGRQFSETFKTTHQQEYMTDAACVSCHHKELAGFSQDWNHILHVAYAKDDCQRCHHGTEIAAEPAACSSCHSLVAKGAQPALREAAHSTCRSCHEERFTNGMQSCVDCHALKIGKEQLLSVDADLVETVPTFSDPTFSDIVAVDGNNTLSMLSVGIRVNGKGPEGTIPEYLQVTPCVTCHYGENAISGVWGGKMSTTSVAVAVMKLRFLDRIVKPSVNSVTFS